MKNSTFKIYKFEFVCDVCKEPTIMGIIGYSAQFHKICDLCLAEVEEVIENTEKLSEEEKAKKDKAKK